MPKSKTSPTQRSLKWLRDQGYAVAVVEQNKRVPDPKSPGGWRMFKRDLFGFADLIAVHPEKPGTLYIQVTGGMNNKGERQTKIEQAAAAPHVLKAGNTIHLHIWRKLKPRGVKVPRWTLARFQIFHYHPNSSDMKWVDLESSESAAVETPLFAAAEDDF